MGTTVGQLVRHFAHAFFWYFKTFTLRSATNIGLKMCRRLKHKLFISLTGWFWGYYFIPDLSEFL
jgi:hypothetical protein